jgi:hypothetical protein
MRRCGDFVGGHVRDGEWRIREGHVTAHVTLMQRERRKGQSGCSLETSDNSVDASPLIALDDIKDVYWLLFPV